MYRQHATGKMFMSPDAANSALRSRWLAFAWIISGTLVALALVLFIVAVPLRYIQLRTPPASIQAGLAQLGISVEFYAAYLVALSVIYVVGCFAVAAVIVWRKSKDMMALFVALMLVLLGTADMRNMEALTGLHPAWEVLALFLVFLVSATLVIFFFLFPDGRFVPRWAGVPILLWSAGLLYLLFPIGLYPALEPPSDWAFPMFVAGLCAGMIAQIYRYVRVSHPVQRQQTKWVVFGTTAAVTGPTVVSMLPALFPSLAQPGLPALLMHLASDTAITFCLLLIPGSIGIAVLRYRLWDIDPIVNRTLVYGGLTTGVVGVYVLVVGGLGAVFQTGGNLVISLVATALVAVLFQPLRNWLQRGVNRLMYGERDEPYGVISRLGQRLEATLAPNAVLPTIVKTVKEALKLPYAAIALKEDEAFVVVAEAGLRDSRQLPPPLSRFDGRGAGGEGQDLTLPLVYQGETVGNLILAPRGSGETFSAADRRLLDDLARQAGIAAHAVQLTLDLQRSRERLVTAREEERRRLRRDLHDGLGPQLASLTLKLDAARNLLGHNPAATDALLAELKGQTQGAISDIRRLVYALRPPALDDLGLVSALREQAAQYQHTGVRITVEAPENLPSLPAAVEVAAYRIAQEALTNVVRHADAHNCTIRLAFDNGLCVEVTDDGHGIEAHHRAGVGLQSMRERAEELGGTCLIEAIPTGGTRVRARLPLT